jgi:hypothetical protein
MGNLLFPDQILAKIGKRFFGKSNFWGYHDRNIYFAKIVE